MPFVPFNLSVPRNQMTMANKEKIDRAARVCIAAVGILILVMMVAFGAVTPTFLEQKLQQLAKRSDCIQANTTIIKEVPSLWPPSETIRKCIAQHAVFVQLEYFCRVLNGTPEMEVHSYSDYVKKKITITVNVRRPKDFI